jgi:hypothetical protein
MMVANVGIILLIFFFKKYFHLNTIKSKNSQKKKIKKNQKKKKMQFSIFFLPLLLLAPAASGSQLRASVVEYVPLFKTVPVNASEARAIIGTNLAGYEALGPNQIFF